jgi:hypothetical protein
MFQLTARACIPLGGAALEAQRAQSKKILKKISACFASLR